MPNWLKKILIIVLLAVVIGGSFWISFMFGKQMLSPTKKLPKKLTPPKLKATMPEPDLSSISIEVETNELPVPKIKEKVIVKPKTIAKTTPSTSSKTYQVQVGAYRYPKNASTQIAKLKEKGFDAYSQKAGNLYRVYAGSYKSLSNARAQVNSLKTAGFEAIVK